MNKLWSLAIAYDSLTCNKTSASGAEKEQK